MSSQGQSRLILMILLLLLPPHMIRPLPPHNSPFRSSHISRRRPRPTARLQTLMGPHLRLKIPIIHLQGTGITQLRVDKIRLLHQGLTALRNMVFLDSQGPAFPVNPDPAASLWDSLFLVSLGHMALPFSQKSAAE